jgi:phage FluMu protein Com
MSEDVRCPECNKLLIRDNSVKCPRCKEIYRLNFDADTNKVSLIKIAMEHVFSNQN